MPIEFTQEVCIPTKHIPKISAPLLEILNNGKLANVVISFKEISQDAEAESTFIETSMAQVVDILYAQKDRLQFTLKLMYEPNKIMVNGVDLKLVADVAAVEHVADIDGDEKIEKKKRKFWKRFKSSFRSKK